MSFYHPNLSAAPFGSKDANLILRSSDHVEFRVHKHIVSLASPVLAALISVASRQTPPSAPRRHRKPVIITLAESSEALELLLRFIYPIPEPSLTLDDITTLVELARRYDSRSVMSRVRTHLLLPAHLDSDPLTVYTLANAAGLPDVARQAARRTLRDPIPPPAQLAEMGPALVRLLQYRRACVSAAVRVARIADDTVPWWIQLQWKRFCFLSECGWDCARVLPRTTLRWHKTVHERVDVPRYWVEYMNAVGERLAGGEGLDPAVARDPVLVRRAVEEAMRCSRCAGRAFWDMEEFARILEQAIEEAISGVAISESESYEYEDDTSRALISSDKMKYLLPSDKPVWPLFDYFFNVYSKRVEQPHEGDTEDECDLVSLPPSSDY